MLDINNRGTRFEVYGGSVLSTQFFCKSPMLLKIIS